MVVTSRSVMVSVALSSLGSTKLLCEVGCKGAIFCWQHLLSAIKRMSGANVSYSSRTVRCTSSRRNHYFASSRDPFIRLWIWPPNSPDLWTVACKAFWSSGCIAHAFVTSTSWRHVWLKSGSGSLTLTRRSFIDWAIKVLRWRRRTLSASALNRLFVTHHT